MHTKKQAASSQAAWSLLSEGVASSRLEAHRIRNLLSRVLTLVAASEQKDHLYEVAGDIIQAMPTRMEALERNLDRTSYALAVLGEDHLRERLPMADRILVDESVDKAHPLFGPMLNRVSHRYLQADLNPPLGSPGGSCYLIDRIETRVRDPELREDLIDNVERGTALDNPEASKVYPVSTEPAPPGLPFKQLHILPHSAYRMDLRSIPMKSVHEAFASFAKEYHRQKSMKGPFLRSWEESFMRAQPITWKDPKTKLTIVFVSYGKDLKLVTSYWTGTSDPKPPGEGGCQS